MENQQKSSETQNNQRGDRFVVALTLAMMRDVPGDEQMIIYAKAGFSNREIGAMVGLSANAVQLRLQRSKKQAKTKSRG